MNGRDPEGLWLKLLETEDALIPEGLHIVGKPMSDAARHDHVATMADKSSEARARVDTLLQGDTELPALMRALSARYIAPVAGGDLIRSPDVLPTGRNIHAFDPFRMPTEFALRDGHKQAQVLLDAQTELPRSIALVLWGSDNIKSDGGPIAQALALMGAKPRFDGYGRLSGADLIPLEKLGRPRIDVVMTLSGIFRDLLPLQTKMLAEAAYKCAAADEPTSQNFVRAHALSYAAQMDVDLETAALRVFSNANGAYGSNVNAMVDASAFDNEDELADAYEARKSFAYGMDGKAAAHAELLQKQLKDVDVAYQNLESVELGVTTVDHYFDTLGGIARAVKRAKGGAEPAVFIGDQTMGDAKVRTLSEQVALETRSRSLNPKWFEGMLQHGHEGVRQIEACVTNTMGWSATTGQVDEWVYERLSETFVLDDAMRQRLADLNPQASVRMANRLLEASDRNYWTPDAETLAALQDAADALEDQMEGIAAY
jgi:magnesium chelatase subunit H